MFEAPLFFKIFFVIIILAVIGVFAFTLMLMFGTKTKSKLLARQVKSLRGATDLSKEDIESMLTNLSDVSIKSRKKVIEENEDNLKDIADANARINKGAVKETAKAFKEGFTSSNKTYCKYCGAEIDADSVYCNKCGKKLI